MTSKPIDIVCLLQRRRFLTYIFCSFSIFSLISDLSMLLFFFFLFSGLVTQHCANNNQNHATNKKTRHAQLSRRKKHANNDQSCDRSVYRSIFQPLYTLIEHKRYQNSSTTNQIHLVRLSFQRLKCEFCLKHIE